MQPNDPVVGGTVLRRVAIQSPNFQHLIAGWSINQDGTAEFNGVTISGGQLILVNSSGTVVGTLDGQNGLVLYGNGTPSNPGMTLSPFGDLFWANLGAGGVQGPRIEVGDTALYIEGGLNTGDTAPAVLTVDTHQNSAGFSSVQTYPLVAGSDLTSSGFPTPPVETWHSITLQNGWTNQTPNNLEYKCDAQGWLKMRGVIVAGTTTDGTVIGAVNSHYVPQFDTLLLIARDGAAGAARIVIRHATGNIEIYDEGGAGALAGWEQVTYPILANA